MQTSMNEGTSVTGAAAATGARADASTAKLNAEILADLAKLGQEEKAPDPPAVEPEAPADPAAPAEPEAPAAQPADPGEPEEVPLDPAAKKRIEAEQARDRKHREMVAREKGEIEAARRKLEEEWKPRVEVAERFEALKGSGVRGALKAIELLGLEGDDLETLARAAYALSPNGQKDPKAKAQAATTVRDRDIETRLEKLARENEDLRRMVTEREQAAKAEAEVTRYLGTVEATLAKAEAPLVRRMAEKAPARARATFHRVALELLDQTGAVPDPAAVVAEAERRERADLEERGIAVEAILAPPKPAAAPAKKPSPTLANAGGAPAAAPAKPLSGRELDAEILKGLQALRSSGSV